MVSPQVTPLPRPPPAPPVIFFFFFFLAEGSSSGRYVCVPLAEGWLCAVCVYHKRGGAGAVADSSGLRDGRPMLVPTNGNLPRWITPETLPYGGTGFFWRAVQSKVKPRWCHTHTREILFFNQCSVLLVLANRKQSSGEKHGRDTRGARQVRYLGLDTPGAVRWASVPVCLQAKFFF